MRSPGTQRQRERVVEFEAAPNREGGMEERNSEGGRPLEFGAEGNKIQGTNLSPLLVAYLGRNENGQPLQSSLTSVYGGHQPSTNVGGNLPPNAHGDGVAGIKRRCRNLSSDGVRKGRLRHQIMTTASGRNRIQSDLEDSNLVDWRRY
ncbi:hypothetical protein Tco_1208262 [Tanacetum coccineum]